MASSKGKNAANIVTICRIICSLIILFLQPFSLSFYIVYILAGLTDIFDGMIARRMQTESELGAKLDSIADFIFVAVCLIKILPAISVPKWLWIWIGVIAAIKIINVISGYVIYKKMVVEHTLMNKVSGLVLFVLPISFAFIDLKYSAGVVGVITTFAAIQEGHYIRTGRMKV